MIAHDYLVEMSFTPFANLPSPHEAASFLERLALPTLEACQRLQESGRILAGGTALAAVGFSFIIRVDSPQELEDTLAALPLWPRAQTRVVPLGTFAARANTLRARLAKTQAPATDPAALAGAKN